MANIYYLNQQPHPLWNILTDLGEHGLHMFPQQMPHAYAEHVNRHHHHHQRTQNTNQPTPPESGAQNAPDNDNSRSPPLAGGVDESSAREPEQEENIRDLPFRGRGCRRGRGGPWGHVGHAAWGPHRRQRHCRPGPGQPAGTPPDFLQQFINNFSNQFGVDISEVFNLVNGASAGRSDDKQVDFVPRADVFDTAAQYIIHVSLPGAQKKDISVDYDAETSTLLLAGVVYRPNVDEELSNALVVDGRSREVGVFEREISLGSRDRPVARVDADNISAKLLDGVLVVTLPKVVVDRDSLKRRISVDQVRDENGRASEADAGSTYASEKEEAGVESQAMQIDSENEASEAGSVTAGRRSPPSPSVRSEEEEERDYVAVDVD
ncbi:conserved hypothetical protein [Histoplasma capsulatum H143]|uniref:SHSP domain-containing protein n=1 Tax=Ajellomyces capsulatus (strain H143) TaxID=544712 RepID=C6HNN4_AJECH|nr:conserved hypothetical protein [Histoplasma capsulatum H143]